MKYNPMTKTFDAPSRQAILESYKRTIRFYVKSVDEINNWIKITNENVADDGDLKERLEYLMTYSKQLEKKSKELQQQIKYMEKV